MNGRTDLATEAAGKNQWNERDLRRQERCENGISVTRMHIRSPYARQQIGKPIGHYVTIGYPSLSDDETRLPEIASLLAKELTTFLPPTGTVLVVGLGNRTVTPDAIGPATADRVLATRHIRGEFARSAGLDDLRPTAVIAPGVLGQTGAESSEIIRGICQEVKPSAVIAVDALAAEHPARLGCTVQLCDTGISPGSGVGNNRQPLNQTTVGVPVIGMGVPTVVDASTLVQPAVSPVVSSTTGMMVTPREIDLVIYRAARLMATAINQALQPAYSPDDLMAIAYQP